MLGENRNATRTRGREGRSVGAAEVNTGSSLGASVGTGGAGVGAGAGTAAGAGAGAGVGLGAATGMAGIKGHFLRWHDLFSGFLFLMSQSF